MMILLEQLPAWVWLVPALPLFAVIVNGARVLLGRARGDAAEPLTARLSSLAAFGGLVLLVAIDGLALTHGAPGHRRLGHWFGSGNWEASNCGSASGTPNQGRDWMKEVCSNPP